MAGHLPAIQPHSAHADCDSSVLFVAFRFDVSAEWLYQQPGIAHHLCGHWRTYHGFLLVSHLLLVEITKGIQQCTNYFFNPYFYDINNLYLRA